MCWQHLDYRHTKRTVERLGFCVTFRMEPKLNIASGIPSGLNWLQPLLVALIKSTSNLARKFSTWELPQEQQCHMYQILSDRCVV